MTLQERLTELLAKAEQARTDENISELEELLPQIEETQQQLARLAELDAQLKSATPTPEPEASEEPNEEPEPEPEPEVEAKIEPEPVKEPVKVEAEPEKVEPEPAPVAEKKVDVKELELVPAASRSVVTAASDIPNVTPGSEMTSIGEVTEAIIRRRSTFRGPSNVTERIPVATVRASRERPVVGNDVAANMEAITAAVKARRDSLTAAGACAPSQPIYDIFGLGSDARPLLDGLPSVTADRARVRYVPGYDISDFSAGYTQWTLELDETDPQTNSKNCYAVACDPDTEAELYAAVLCLTFGNIQGRAFPEQVTEAVRVAHVAYAREAERQLLALIDAASTAVTTTQVAGAAVDGLGFIEQLAAGIRNRRRAPDEPITVVLPAWLKAQWRFDLSRRISGDSLFSVSDATMNQFLTDRMLDVIWTLEGDTGEDFGAQGAGALAAYPTPKARVFPTGAHVALDGGTLDLGVVRDSTLNSTNTYQLFFESFEGIATPGYDSYILDLPTCNSGAVGSTVDITCV